VTNVSSATEEPVISIRDVELPAGLPEIEDIQREVWGCDDRDLVPPTILAATLAVGSILVGAYDGSSLVGFAYGFVGYEGGRLTHHSHMLAVRPRYRNFNLGYKLKLAQRERVLAQGINRMTWTFDPMQALNAHFNFGKLGVLADRYKINFYGEATSSFLHQTGTDRLWVSWPLDSLRVRARLRAGAGEKVSPPDLGRAATLVRVGANDEPQWDSPAGVPRAELLGLEIPADINALQRERPGLAVRWREATRRAFTEAMASGYLVEEFYRSSRQGRPVGVYLLSYGKGVEEFA
jgi:predicted GNAT superfamily acetyltransferase